MVMLALGLGVLALLFWAARAFSRASVSSIKALFAWIAALAGLSLAGLLLLTGRGAAALSGAVLLGPLIWNWWRREAGAKPVVRGRSAMSRQEALEVLGLQDPADDAAIRAAWLRLMRAAHPDSGGSDWLAARINQARDVLLGGRR